MLAVLWRELTRNLARFYIRQSFLQLEKADHQFWTHVREHDGVSKSPEISRVGSESLKRVILNLLGINTKGLYLFRDL